MTTHTVLDEERVADLRERVMADVDADVRRRGRRARLAAGTVAASVVLLGLAGGIAAISGEDSPGTSIAIPATEADGAQVAPAPEADPAAPDRTDTAADADRAVVTTGEVWLVVSDPTEAATEFGLWVESEGGRLDHRSDRDSRSELTVRVPASAVNAALEQLRELGDVSTTTVDHLDVTSQVVDLDARIAALGESIDRLTAILAAATTTDEVVEAESILTQRQAELDSLVAQRNALGDQVDLSTIDVTFSQTTATAEVEPEGFLGGLQTGWNSLVSTVNSVLTAAGVAAPWLGIALVAGGGLWLLMRLRRKR